MLIFWLLITIMTLIAMGILAFPLLRGVSKSSSSMSFKNSALSFLLLLLLPLIAITLYWKLGASHAVAAYKTSQQQAAAVDAEIQQLGSIQHIIQQLKQAVAAHPDSHGWFLLGRLYLQTQQYPLAIDAFTAANQLTPDQPANLVGYAESVYFNNHMVLNAAARQALTRALQLQPQQPDAINLLAMAAYQQKDYTQAITYWEQLLALLQPNTQEASNVLSLIATAQKQRQRKSTF